MNSTKETFVRISQIFKRRWFAMFIVILVGVGAGILGYRFLPQYEASSSVLLISQDQNHDTGVSSVDMPSLLMSSSVAGVVRRNIAPGTDIATFEKSIANQVAVGGNVMQITFKSKTRDGAVKGANALAERMQAYYREIAGSRFTALESYLQQQMDAKRAKLTSIDQRLQNAAVKNPYVGQAAPINALTTNLLNLEANRGQVEAAMRGDLARTKYDTRQLSVLAPTVKHELETNDASYHTLELQVAQDGAKLASLKAEYQPSYPGVTSLQKQYDREVAALQDIEKNLLGKQHGGTAGGSPTYLATLAVKNQAASSLEADRAQLAALDTQINRTLTAIHQLPHNGVTVAMLTSERTAAEAAYQALSLRQTNVLADEAQAAAIGSVVVVDRASTADSKFGKRAALILAASVAVFTVIAFTLALLLEALDERLRTSDAIARLYGKPVIGTIGAK